MQHVHTTTTVAMQEHKMVDLFCEGATARFSLKVTFTETAKDRLTLMESPEQNVRRHGIVGVTTSTPTAATSQFSVVAIVLDSTSDAAKLVVSS